MKIEKLSENQIRCTLSRKDLADRHIGLKDLAYGAPQTKELFREMMEQAFTQFGFDAEDIPLMIEATPMPGENLVLVITKIDNPDELDTRFSQFTPAESKEELSALGADDVLNTFEQLRKMFHGLTEGKGDELPFSPEETKTPATLTRIYRFPTLDAVITMAGRIASFYHGQNSLYKDRSQDDYELILEMSDHTPEEFNKICNMIAEYAAPVTSNYTEKDHILEHGEAIVLDQAIQILAGM